MRLHYLISTGKGKPTPVDPTYFKRLNSMKRVRKRFWT